MFISEIQEIIDHKADPCISLIIPTHRTSPERRYDNLITNKIVVEVKNLLTLLYATKKFDINIIFEKIDASIDAIDFDHLEDGIGIFISPEMTKTISFPFPVIQKVKIDTSFYARDLLYYLQTRFEYTVLSISQKQVQLFSCEGDKLTEIFNGDFPLTYSEEYEYSKPISMSTYGSHISKIYEKDKGEMQDNRSKAFFKTAHNLLKNHQEINQKVVLAGDKKDILLYEQATKKLDHVIGKLVGNFNFNSNSTHLLAQKSWEIVQLYLKKKQENTLNSLPELVGKDMLAIGVSDVWRTTNEGKGMELIVEKDYLIPAYLSKDGNTLKLHHSGTNENFVHYNDIIEKIIRTVLGKNGKIQFVENNILTEFDGIVLKLRYPDIG